jgi:hypothetical protein
MRNKSITYTALTSAGIVLIFLLIPYLTGLSVFGVPIQPAPAKTEGNITLPPSYITLTDTMGNWTWNNNDTNINLTYIDGNLTRFIVHSQYYIDMGWPIHYICNSVSDIKNATLTITMQCNQTINVSLIMLAQGPKPNLSLANQTLRSGLNTYNFTLIGQDGLFENVTEAIDSYLFCMRNNMFMIRMIIPQDYTNEDFELEFDQIATRFYATNLTSSLYTQFFN